MWYNFSRSRKPLALLWPTSLLATAAAAALWLRLARHNGLQVLLASTLLAGTVALGLLWQARARAARRLQAVVDAYAERQMAETSAGNAPQKGWTSPARKVFAHRSPSLRTRTSSPRNAAS